MKEIVPTTENIKLFRMETVSGGEWGAYVSELEKISKNRWKLEINKPCTEAPSKDWKVKQLDYDVKKCIFKEFQVKYFDADSEKWIPIPNKHLRDMSLSSYTVTPTGLWGCSKGELFFLDAECNELVKSPSKIFDVLEMEILPDGRLHLSVLESVTLIEKNQFYSHTGGDYEGYYDYYELAIKNLYGRTDGYEAALKKQKEATRRKEEELAREKELSGKDKPQEVKGMNCKKCGKMMPENAKFCMECGAKVEQEVICDICGAKMPVGYKFCGECGSWLSVPVIDNFESMKNDKIEENEAVQEPDWDSILKEVEERATYEAQQLIRKYLQKVGWKEIKDLGEKCYVVESPKSDSDEMWRYYILNLNNVEEFMKD